MVEKEKKRKLEKIKDLSVDVIGDEMRREREMEWKERFVKEWKNLGNRRKKRIRLERRRERDF